MSLKPTETETTMREVIGDLWDLPADARCITINGTLKKDARGVMGRGVAKQAKLRYIGMEARLGHHLVVNGNHVGVLIEPDEECSMPLVAFPVKHDWYDKLASLELIKQSATELMALIDTRGWSTVLLPRPGCGNGGLNWIYVRRVVAPILDARCVIVTTAREADEAYWKKRWAGGGSAKA